jgi:hypothetical protein
MERWQIALLVSLLTWLLNQPWLSQPVFVLLLISWISLVLDLIADNQLKRDISRLLEPKWNTAAPVAATTILAIFDLIYALPLLLTRRGRAYLRMIRRAHWTPLKAWWWAFWPSTLITVIVTVFVTYRYFRSPGDDAAFWSGIAVNIVSDYLALFVIRNWLVTGRVSLLQALFLAPLAGMLAGILLVISFTGLRLVLFMTINLYPFDVHAAFCKSVDLGFCAKVGADGQSLIYLDKWDFNAVQRMLTKLSQIHFPGVLAACLVHVWLPLFALLTIMLKLINIPLYAVTGVVRAVRLWVGKDHPVLALGVFAGLLAMLALWLQDPPPWLQYMLRWLASLPSLLS